MTVTVPSDWTASQAAQNAAAVNITKGNYILYINVNATQASGVTGGRFAEIAQGAPSADAVVTIQPSPPCGTQEKTSAFDKYSRVDLYVSASDKKDYCAVPTNASTVWYFSYLTDQNNGYFNYYQADQPPGLVVTMAYNLKDVNSLPVKGSSDLNTAFSDMTSIAKSLVIKSNPTTASAQSTESWKIYTNTKYGFKFEYPPTWSVTSENNSNDYYQVQMNAHGNSYLNIHVDDNPQNLSISDFYKKKDPSKNFTLKVINNQNFYNVSTSANESYIANNNKIYVIDISAQGDISNEITSTFKFTN